MRKTFVNIVHKLGYYGIILDFHVSDKKSLKALLEKIGRYFDFISLEDLSDRMSGSFSRPFCLVTFDDGKKQHATEVADVLKSKGIPAVFYVVTGALDTGRPLWFDLTDWILSRINTTPSGLDRRSLKNLPLDLIQKRLDETIMRYGLQLPNHLNEPSLCPMSWDDARRLHSEGFAIGAHGVTHAILTNETPEHARFEIKHSMRRVREELGAPCPSFAFPNGNFNSQLVRMAAETGAETIMTTVPRWVERCTSQSVLPRIQLHPHKGSSMAFAKISAALPGFLLKNPNRYGRMR